MTEAASPTRRSNLEAAIQLTLLDRAKATELRLADFRAALVAMFVAIDTWVYVVPSALGETEWPVGSTAVDVVALIAAVGFTVWLRRGGYRPWIRVVVPLAESTFVWVAVVAFMATVDGLEGATNGFSFVPLAGALFVGLAALRYHRGVLWLVSAQWTVAIAAAGLMLRERVTFATTALTCLDFVGVAFIADRLCVAVSDALRAEIGKGILARFLPGGVGALVYADPLELVSTPREGEATILVTDIRGFTTFAQDRSPSDVLAFLDRVQGRLAGIVTEQGGTVDKFLGDGMLAVFGAPSPVPDHAQRALLAARRIRAATVELGCQIGIGIQSGRVISGVLGDATRLEFTVLGDPVNTASRLESLTKELGVDIVVGARTAELANDGDLVPLGETSIRGRTGTLAVFTLKHQ